MTLRNPNPIRVPLAHSLGAPATLPLAMIYQSERNWCWAACIEMVRTYDAKSPPRAQCDLANTAFGQVSCCSTPSGDNCDRPLQVVSISAEWARYGYGSSYSGGHLPWPRTNNNIVNRRPVEVGLSWTGGGGHAVLLVGTDTINGVEWLVVHDPTRGVLTHTQASMRSAYGLGAWRWSWDNII